MDYKRLLWGLILSLGFLLCYLNMCQCGRNCPANRQPEVAPQPARPCPDCRPAQQIRPIRPLRPTGVYISGPTSTDGVELTTDLPRDQRIENIGSHRDGAGMCVMSSAEMAARWQNLEILRGIRDWAAQDTGGGWPSRFDEQIRTFCRQRNVAVPSYINYEGRDLTLLRNAIRTGRMVAVTYSGRDRVRYTTTISHMVNLVHIDETHVCLLDNNFPGDNEYLWMTVAEFQSRWSGSGNGWAIVFLAPPPPPAPHN